MAQVGPSGASAPAGWNPGQPGRLAFGPTTGGGGKGMAVRPVTRPPETLQLKDHVRRHITRRQTRRVCCCIRNCQLWLPRGCLMWPLLVLVALGITAAFTATAFVVTTERPIAGTWGAGAPAGTPIAMTFTHNFGPWNHEDDFKLANSYLDFAATASAKNDCAAIAVGSYSKSACARSLEERCYIVQFGSVAGAGLNVLAIPTLFISHKFLTNVCLALAVVSNIAVFFALTNNMREETSFPENDQSGCSYGYSGSFTYEGAQFTEPIRTYSVDTSQQYVRGYGYYAFGICWVLGLLVSVAVEFTVDPGCAHAEDDFFEDAGAPRAGLHYKVEGQPKLLVDHTHI